MEIKVLEKGKDYIRFVLEGVSPAFANALRRIMIAEVPTMAIDEVVIIENTTSFFDEYIAHRLGMIPLKTDLQTYVLPEECECGGKGCSRCQVVLTIQKEAKEDYETLYSGEITSTDPAITPVNPNIPIIKMMKGERLVVEAIARLGRGKEHAKWQAAHVAYKYLPVIKINKESCDLCGKCVEACPKRILEIADGKLKVKDPYLCSMCRSCEEVCEKEAIKIGWDDRTFIFYVESVSGLSPEEIVLKAADILVKKVKKMKSELEQLSPKQLGEKGEGG